MISFAPINLMYKRLEASQTESDVNYFFDLLLMGEMVTKITAAFLVANIDNDKDRNRYRQEYLLIRANSLGDFSSAIDDIMTGTSFSFLSSSLSNNEIPALNNRIGTDTWQAKSVALLIKCLDVFNLEYNKVSVKTPFRIWFSLFTLLRNKTKGHGATTSHQCSQVCSLLAESIDLIIDNLTLFKRPWVSLYRNLTGKYRVSYITERNTAFDFLKRETNHSYNNGVYCFTDTIRAVNLCLSNPEATEFYLPNGNYKNNTYETISYVDDKKHRVDASSYITPITQLPSSMTEGRNEMDVIENCFSNVPVISDEYVLRKDFEDELNSILCEKDRFPVVTLKGRGGIGKTSLAIKVIKDLSSKKRFDLIMWFSARDVDLFSEGPKQVKSQILTQEDISKEYCKLIYPTEKITDPIEVFSRDLSKNPLGNTLYVLDNFETITNPVDVYEWLNTHIRNPNKILITSRMSRNFKADYPIEVSGMNESQCRVLIKRISEKYEIQHLVTDDYIEDIINESDGHPYIIKVLLGEVARTRKIGKIERIIAEKDQILNALFRRTFQSLSPASKRVFLTLCSWNSAIPLIALEAVLWRNDNEKINVDDAIDELQKSSFIELIEIDEDIFINVPLAASLYGKTELSVYPEKLHIIDDRALLMEFGASTTKNIKNGVAPKIERKFQSVAKRIKTKGEFEKELPTLEYIASKYPKAWLFITDMYREFGDTDGMKQSLREILKVSTLSEEKEQYWDKYASLCKDTEDWVGESMALSELVMIPNVTFETISNCAMRINNYFYTHSSESQLDYRQSLFEKVASIMASRIAGEGDATDYSRLAWLYLNINNEEKAKLFMSEGLKVEPDNRHCLRLQARLNK